jgi:hypothetical protein
MTLLFMFVTLKYYFNLSIKEQYTGTGVFIDRKLLVADNPLYVLYEVKLKV